MVPELLQTRLLFVLGAFGSTSPGRDAQRVWTAMAEGAPEEQPPSKRARQEGPEVCPVPLLYRQSEVKA